MGHVGVPLLEEAVPRTSAVFASVGAQLNPTAVAAPEPSGLQPPRPGTQNAARPAMASGLQCEGTLGMGWWEGSPRSGLSPLLTCGPFCLTP